MLVAQAPVLAPVKDACHAPLENIIPNVLVLALIRGFALIVLHALLGLTALDVPGPTQGIVWVVVRVHLDFTITDAREQASGPAPPAPSVRQAFTDRDAAGETPVNVLSGIRSIPLQSSHRRMLGLCDGLTCRPMP